MSLGAQSTWFRRASEVVEAHKDNIVETWDAFESPLGLEGEITLQARLSL